MDPAGEEFVRVLGYAAEGGRPRPMEALEGWLRERGVDGVPFDPALDLRLLAPCGRTPDGGWDRTVHLLVRASALRRVGLSPPTADG